MNAWGPLLAVVLALASGCLEGGQAPAAEDGPQVVRLTGRVEGEGRGSSSFAMCDAAPNHHLDLANRTVTLVKGTTQVAPEQAEALVILDGSFFHARDLPCFPFKGVTLQPPGPHEARLRVNPFEMATPFRIDGGAVVAQEKTLRKGESLTIPVDVVADGTRYTGNLVLENLGRWPAANVRLVESAEDLPS